MKIGIVGSSHSYGYNGKDVKLTPRLYEQLNEMMPEHEFICKAMPGRGSELYANRIMHLVEDYKLYPVFIQPILNIGTRYIYNGPYWPTPSSPNVNFERLKKDYMISYSPLWHEGTIYTTSIDHKNVDYVPKPKFKIWSDVNQILHDDMAAGTVACIDLHYARKICQMANVIDICWTVHNGTHLPNDHPDIKSVYHLIKLKQHYNPRRVKSWSNDGVHMNIYWQKKVLKEYIIPTIKLRLGEIDV